MKSQAIFTIFFCKPNLYSKDTTELQGSLTKHVAHKFMNRPFHSCGRTNLVRLNVRLRLTLFWYNSLLFSYWNYAGKILVSIGKTWFTCERRKGCIKIRSTPASLSSITVKCSISSGKLNQQLKAKQYYWFCYISSNILFI